MVIFSLKMSLFILFFMLVSWTIPRFRFDQLMGLAWKVLIPLALLNLVCVMVVRQLVVIEHVHPGLNWVLLPMSLLLLVGAGLVAGYAPPTRQTTVPIRARRTSEVVSR